LTLQSVLSKKGKIPEQFGKRQHSEQLLKNCCFAKHSSSSREPAFLPWQWVTESRHFSILCLHATRSALSCLRRTQLPASPAADLTAPRSSTACPRGHQHGDSAGWRCSHRRLSPWLVFSQCAQPTSSLPSSCVGLSATQQCPYWYREKKNCQPWRSPMRGPPKSTLRYSNAAWFLGLAVRSLT